MCHEEHVPLLKQQKHRLEDHGFRPELKRHVGTVISRTHQNLGVSIATGVPTNGWFLLRKSQSKIRMMTGGAPILGNPHLDVHHS